MLKFAAGFLACAVVGVLRPKAAARLNGYVSNAVQWIRQQLRRGPLE